MKITGVDNDTYSLTGEAFSHIASPNSISATPRKLQEDDVALAYEFSRKFVSCPPRLFGYTQYVPTQYRPFADRLSQLSQSSRDIRQTTYVTPPNRPEIPASPTHALCVASC